MHTRHITDKAYMQENFELRSSLDSIGPKYICHDSLISSSRCASYSGFHIPLRMRCLANYIQAGRKYEEQFQKEIKNLIDNQTSALEACQFVRMMSYTTLWPPLHNAKELASTSKKFFQLDKKEKQRLQKVMTTDYT
ncbi:uncharacterized protein Dwil_GK27769 [Drosophila willistoni]|uniref:Uncharacterized protein n=2 Tax=Drosophila willistoni TaxID=7260 RepID=A0A0Q9X3I9_DROWI|nr:uncharacterized protein Dwil_GK27769 [Drosophila willistoni]